MHWSQKTNAWRNVRKGWICELTILWTQIKSRPISNPPRPQKNQNTDMISWWKLGEGGVKVSRCRGMDYQSSEPIPGNGEFDEALAPITEHLAHLVPLAETDPAPFSMVSAKVQRPVECTISVIFRGWQPRPSCKNFAYCKQMPWPPSNLPCWRTWGATCTPDIPPLGHAGWRSPSSKFWNLSKKCPLPQHIFRTPSNAVVQQLS